MQHEGIGFVVGWAADGAPLVIGNGALYPDGTVAAFEELIGSQGDLGGEQTDAFPLHPPNMAAPETHNSEDFFHVLNARRGLPPGLPLS